MPRQLKGGQKRFDLARGEMPDVLALPGKIRRKVMREAARVVALDVRETAPDSGIRHKGKLRKSIRYQVLQGGLIGQVSSKAPHAHLVHDGARPHEINAKSPESAKAGWRFYAGGAVHHPGQKAQPFLVESAERKQAQIEQVLHDGAAAALAEIAAGA